MLGQRLRELRTHQGCSLRQLAKKTGLSHGFLCDLEHGRSNPSLANLRLLAEAMGVEPEFFLTKEVGKNDRPTQA